MVSGMDDADAIEMDDWVLAGCACPACAASRGAVMDDALIAQQTATAGGYAIDTVTDDPDQAIDALLGGVAWTTPSLTFSFPDSVDDITYNWYGEKSGFGAFNEVQQAAAREALSVFSSVSKLTFSELQGEADRDADLTFAVSTQAGTAYAYFPSSGDWGGDAWFNTAHFNNPEVGTYAWATFLHEIGHALGLKHGHDAVGPGALPSQLDSHEYSLMTYRSYEGSSGAYYSNELYGGPQSLMMLDIAAIQVLYGANYEFNSGDTTYSFDLETGQMFVDGVGETTPGANRILRTIWDGGGEDVYDLSAYSTDLAIDLSPGGFVDLDVGGLAQRSQLGPGIYAKGHVFNALQWAGDDRSLIENAIAGAGDDTLIGNHAANRLDGGAGDDVLAGGLGDDELIGGEGADVAVFDGLFSAFSVDFVGDVLEVIGAGFDRVFASVETLRFDDIDFAFEDFRPVQPPEPEPTNDEPPGDGINGAEQDPPAEAEGEGGEPSDQESKEQETSVDDPAEPNFPAEVEEGETDPPAEDVLEEPPGTDGELVPDADQPNGSEDTGPESGEPVEGDEEQEQDPEDDLELEGLTDGEPTTVEPTGGDEAEDESKSQPVTDEPLSTPEDEAETPSLDEPDTAEPADEPSPDPEPEQDEEDDSTIQVIADDQPTSVEEDLTDVPLPVDKTDDPIDPETDIEGTKLLQPTGVTATKDDFILGETGADAISGGRGDDTLSGAGGQDTLRGGQGDDLLLGGAADDRLSGGGGADLLKGGGGDDHLSGGRDADTLNGSGGDDVLAGGGGHDRLIGRVGHDKLIGGGGADTLRGHSGEDSLEGGAGRDLLVGGAGVDRFIFDDGFGRDRIADFDAAAEILDFTQHGGVNSFGDLTIASGAAGVAVLDGAGGRIFLSGVDLSEIDEGDFLF